MSTLADRTARAVLAGLLGLSIATPPPAAADDDDEGRRSHGHAARGERDGDDRDDARHRQLQRGDGDRRQHRDRAPQRRVERDRHEHRRQGPPPRAVRDHVKRDERHHRSDHPEWRDDRRWQDDRRPHRDHRHWKNDRRDERRHRDDWRPARVSKHDHRWHWHDGRWCPPGHRHPPGRRAGWYKPHDDGRWVRYRRPLVVHSPYYCAPCSNWYGQRHDFDQHLYGYHRLPQRSFQDAVAQVAWGLVHFGY